MVEGLVGDLQCWPLSTSKKTSRTRRGLYTGKFLKYLAWSPTVADKYIEVEIALVTIHREDMLSTE